MFQTIKTETMHEKFIKESQLSKGVEVVEPSRWVSVNDKAPEAFKEVLLFGIITAPGYMSESCELGHWNEGYVARGLIEAEQFEVTHWHEIPGRPD